MHPDPPDGFEYMWNASPFTFAGGMWPPASMPDELHPLLWPASKVRANGRAPVILTDKYIEVAFEREVAAVSSATEGSRNDTLNRSAFALARFVRDGSLSATAYVAELTAAALSTGLSEPEVRATLASALRGRG
jgi:hypothetical protein